MKTFVEPLVFSFRPLKMHSVLIKHHKNAVSDELMSVG